MKTRQHRTLVGSFTPVLVQHSECFCEKVHESKSNFFLSCSGVLTCIVSTPIFCLAWNKTPLLHRKKTKYFPPCRQKIPGTKTNLGDKGTPSPFTTRMRGRERAECTLQRKSFSPHRCKGKSQKGLRKLFPA